MNDACPVDSQNKCQITTRSLKFEQLCTLWPSLLQVLLSSLCLHLQLGVRSSETFQRAGEEDELHHFYYQANSGGSWNILREIVLGQFVDYKLAPCKLIQCFTPRAHVGVHVVLSPPILGKRAWWNQGILQVGQVRWAATTNKKLIPSRTLWFLTQPLE